MSDNLLQNKQNLKHQSNKQTIGYQQIQTRSERVQLGLSKYVVGSNKLKNIENNKNRNKFDK